MCNMEDMFWVEWFWICIVYIDFHICSRAPWTRMLFLTAFFSHVVIVSIRECLRF
jgi:hypothetical protein